MADSGARLDVSDLVSTRIGIMGYVWIFSVATQHRRIQLEARSAQTVAPVTHIVRTKALADRRCRQASACAP
ncbi:Uncharacterised protein [Halioglobus japonicus]|nr:Uncharacterised protein [Halioglobus japonicus]